MFNEISQQALALDKDSVKALFRRAQANAAVKDYDEAMVSYRHFLIKLVYPPNLGGSG